MANVEREQPSVESDAQPLRLEPGQVALRLRVMRLYSLARLLVLAAAAAFLLFVIADAVKRGYDPNPLAIVGLLIASALLIRRILRWRHHYVAWRRFRRLQSGRCAFCASSLQGASTCPQCGACAWLCRDSRVEIARRQERSQPLLQRPRLRRPVPGWLR